MSNVIPPLLSSSPPPMVGVLDDEEDDEFGDFRAAVDLSYGCDALSLPSTPEHSPKKQLDHTTIPSLNVDINSNKECGQILETIEPDHSQIDKDYQDKRKNCDEDEPMQVNLCAQKNCIDIIVNTDDKLNTESDSCTDNINSTEEVDKFKNHLQFGNLCQNVSKEVSFIVAKPSVPSTVPNSNKIDQNITVKENVKIDYEENSCNPISYDESNTNLKDTSIEEFNSNDKYYGENSTNFKNEFENVKKFSTSDHSYNEENTNLKSEIIEESTEFNADNHLFSEESSNNFKSEFEEFNEFSSSDDRFHKENINIKNEPVADIKECNLDNQKFDKENLSNSANIDITDNFDNEFGNFEAAVDSAINLSACDDNEVQHVEEFCDHKNVSSVEDEFDDFKTAEPVTEVKCNNKKSDDFGDFENHSFELKQFVPYFKPNELCIPSEPSLSNENLEDFNDFQVNIEVDTIRSVVLEKVSSFITEMFPNIEQSTDDFRDTTNFNNSIIFNAIKDITETNALTYQWNKSSSQKQLLKALNIDMRNILHGHGWNPLIPKFAANLSASPLEPVKSEIFTSASICPLSEGATVPVEIPSAQFDWSSSGLTNPLDYSQTVLLDLEQIVASLDIAHYITHTPKSQNSPTPLNNLDEWDLWLKSLPKEVEKMVVIEQEEVQPSDTIDYSVTSNPDILEPQNLNSQSRVCENPLQLNKIFIDDIQINETLERSDDLENFTTFQSASDTSWLSNAFPLRETHISNLDSKIDHSDWFKPTIATPDLPRKENTVIEDYNNDDEFNDFQMNIPQISEKTNVFETDEQFTDFQSVLPEPQPLQVTCIQPFKGPIESLKPANDVTLESTKVECDALSVPVEPIKPVIKPLEPLQPTVIQTNANSVVPTQINWPAPGLTDDDIRNIELNFTTITAISTDKKINEEGIQKVDTSKSYNLPEKGHEKEMNDDDWSDFVSNTQPMKPSSTFSISERTSTPDLQLSVFNLNRVQPPKQPIPVITPQGLMQTRLPSNSTFPPIKIEPSVQHRPLVSSMPDTYHPSIISNQYSSHFSQHQNNFQCGSLVNNFVCNKSTEVKTGLQQNTSLVGDNDDDWSDFVSSPLPLQVSNCLSTKVDCSSSKSSQANINRTTNAVAPNIITNPGHFESYQNGDVLKQKTVKKIPHVQIKKNTVPSISALPDLDFIAPRNRTFTKK